MSSCPKTYNFVNEYSHLNDPKFINEQFTETIHKCPNCSKFIPETFINNNIMENKNPSYYMSFEMIAGRPVYNRHISETPQYIKPVSKNPNMRHNANYVFDCAQPEWKPNCM